MSEQSVTTTERNTSGMEYVFPNAWGGATRSPAPPQVLAKQRELRLAIGGVAAKKQQGGPMFPVRGAKELVQKAAQAITDADCTISQIAQEITHLETDKVPGNMTSSGKPVFRTLTHIKATVRLTAPDGSFVDWVGSGHGGDVDDKAGGKASTYAFKDAIFKGLMIPDADIVDTDDEQPSETAEKGGRGRKGGNTSPTPAQNAAPGTSDLEAVLTEFKKAESVKALDAVAAQIKGGKYTLVGPDHLRAQNAYTEIRKDLLAKEAGNGN